MLVVLLERGRNCTKVMVIFHASHVYRPRRKYLASSLARGHGLRRPPKLHTSTHARSAGQARLRLLSPCGSAPRQYQPPFDINQTPQRCPSQQRSPASPPISNRTLPLNPRQNPFPKP